MTEQKAIEFLRIQKPTGNQWYKEPTKKAFDMAIEALEKQIPKEPINELCPICGSITHTDCGDSFLDYSLNYCPKCGQALKWK